VIFISWSTLYRDWAVQAKSLYGIAVGIRNVKKEFIYFLYITLWRELKIKNIPRKVACII